MKTSYKISIIIGIIIAIIFFSISMIDYVYGHTRDFESIIRLMCPLVPIPDDFEANKIFFLVYYTNPGKQLEMIWYDIQNTCWTQSEKFQVQEILDYCHQKESGLDMNLPRFSYNNSTHYIDNNICQWQKIIKFPDTNIDCIPGQNKLIKEKAIRNGTHIYNKYNCMWELEFNWEKEYEK